MGVMVKTSVLLQQGTLRLLSRLPQLFNILVGGTTARGSGDNLRDFQVRLRFERGQL